MELLGMKLNNFHFLRNFPVRIPEILCVAKSNNFKWGLNKSVKMKAVSALLMNKAFIVNNKVKLKLVEGLEPVGSRRNEY